MAEPVFVLASYDILACSVALFQRGNVVVAGHRDGSVVCWNREETPVPYESLVLGNGQTNGSGRFDGLSVRLPCFYSAASRGDSHDRAVVDICSFSDELGRKWLHWFSRSID